LHGTDLVDVVVEVLLLDRFGACIAYDHLLATVVRMQLEVTHTHGFSAMLASTNPMRAFVRLVVFDF
jgi:hypothetical protein